MIDLAEDDYDWLHTEHGRVNHAVPLGTPAARDSDLDVPLSGDRVVAVCGKNVYPFPPHNFYPRCSHCRRAIRKAAADA